LLSCPTVWELEGKTALLDPEKYENNNHLIHRIQTIPNITFWIDILTFFFSLLISFFFCAGASRGRSHDGQRSSGTVLSMHIWRSLFSGAAKSNMFADK
jgi:hypothetical protein